jgi:hypothetical protein
VRAPLRKRNDARLVTASMTKSHRGRRFHFVQLRNREELLHLLQKSLDTGFAEFVMDQVASANEAIQPYPLAGAIEDLNRRP